MADTALKKYEELAEEITQAFDLGFRMDIFLVVKSKDAQKIDLTATKVCEQLDCSASQARIAMKEYVARLPKYDPMLVQELR